MRQRVRFMVFDPPSDPDRFEARVLHMRALLGDTGVAWLRPIPQFRAHDAGELDAWLHAIVGAGGESLVFATTA